MIAAVFAVGFFLGLFVGVKFADPIKEVYNQVATKIRRK